MPPGGRIVRAAMAPLDLLVALSPIIVLIVVLSWKAVPTLIAWRRERRYQAEWHRTFGHPDRRPR